MPFTVSYSNKKFARICIPLVIAGLFSLSACDGGYDDAVMAHHAQVAMIGMTANDLQACAGPPTKVTKLNADAQLFTYIYKPVKSGFSVEAPFNITTINVSSSGNECDAHFRIVKDKVVEVHYAGNNDDYVGTDSFCAYIIRGCMRQPEPTMTPLNDQNDDDTGAYTSPPIKNLPYEASYNTPKPATPSPSTPSATPIHPSAVPQEHLPIRPAWLPQAGTAVQPAPTISNTLSK